MKLQILEKKTSLAGYGDDEFQACRVGGTDGKL